MTLGRSGGRWRAPRFDDGISYVGVSLAPYLPRSTRLRFIVWQLCPNKLILRNTDDNPNDLLSAPIQKNRSLEKARFIDRGTLRPRGAGLLITSRCDKGEGAAGSRARGAGSARSRLCAHGPASTRAPPAAPPRVGAESAQTLHCCPDLQQCLRRARQVRGANRAEPARCAPAQTVRQRPARASRGGCAGAAGPARARPAPSAPLGRASVFPSVPPRSGSFSSQQVLHTRLQRGATRPSTQHGRGERAAWR